MRFEWDEAKRLQNLKDHGIDFVDAHKVFAGPTFTFEDDRLRYQEQRFVTLGLLNGIGLGPDFPDTSVEADNGRGGVSWGSEGHLARSTSAKVQMTALPGATIRQVAKDLGISEGLLGHWKRDLIEQGSKAFVGQGHARDEELMRLRRELAKVKKERDFLAEAAAFFARQPK